MRIEAIWIVMSQLSWKENTFSHTAIGMRLEFRLKKLILSITSFDVRDKSAPNPKREPMILRPLIIDSLSFDPNRFMSRELSSALRMACRHSSREFWLI